MTQTKARDLRSLSLAELGQKKSDLEKMLFELRQKKLTGQLDKPHQFKQTRRQIAQISTIAKEMSLKKEAKHGGR